MTELQKKLLALRQKREAVAAIFKKYEDVAAMTAEDLAAVKAANTEIETLDAECKQLEELESMKASNDAGLNGFKHHTTETKPNTKAEEKPRVEYVRYASLKNFNGERSGRSAEERAFRLYKWFAGAVVGIERHKQWCAENGIEIKAHSEGTNTAGGYLVPNEFLNDIIDLREQYGVARRLAKVVPMTRETLSRPRRRSGLTAYWVGEATAITESTKGWDLVNLVAKKLAVLALYSSELDEDAAVSIGDDLAGEIAYAFSNKEDEAYFNGDGTSTYGQCFGIRPKLLAVDGTIGNIRGLKVGTGNAYSELTLADFHGTIGLLPLYARTGAKWVVSSFFWDTVMFPIQTAAGGNTVADIANGSVPRFLGFPVELAQVMPTSASNSQICALLGNYSLGSMIGDRRMITLAISSEYKFAEDQLAIKGTERLDINVHDVGDTSVAGPIVGLITAAA